jgi:cytoskeletal protein CcmA (bactofilin family)
MWWNKRQSTNHGFSVHPEFFLGAQTTAAGTIDLESDVLVDGNYSGSITSGGLIEVGANANVKADINARVGIIEGTYNGKAEFNDEVQIKNCSTISGIVASSNIVVEKGAQLNAQCKTTI